MKTRKQGNPERFSAHPDGSGPLGYVLPGAVILCAIVALGLMSPMLPSRISSERGPAAGTERDPQPETEIGRRIPLRIEPQVSLPNAVPLANIREAAGRLQRPQSGSLSNMLHVLRLFGRGYKDDRAELSESKEFLAVLLDYDLSRERFQGRPTLLDTRHGVRCRVVRRNTDEFQPEREAHSDQLLAILGELGVSLNHPLSTELGEATVRELLSDSLANFDLKQPEIEWSALAYSLYLPPRRSWTDKFGVSHTFDELAEELMGRSFDRACAGTHLLHSLTVMMRADLQEPMLSEPVRARIREHLFRQAERLRSTQRADGSWSFSWYRDRTPGAPELPAAAADSWKEVLVTGHHIEWLLLLPDDMRPPDMCFVQALNWLDRRLRADPLEQLHEYYCPYSHACNVLKVTVLSEEAQAELGETPSHIDRPALVHPTTAKSISVREGVGHALETAPSR